MPALQGIPWASLPFGRKFYRDQRLTTYRNYTNLLPEDNTQYMVSARWCYTNRLPQDNTQHMVGDRWHPPTSRNAAGLSVVQHIALMVQHIPPRCFLKLLGAATPRARK